MRKLLFSCIVLMALAVGQPAVATHDGGFVATLLAVGGQHDRYAVIQYASVQEGCYGGCETFIVDTHAPVFKRLHLATVDEQAVAAYRKKLPKSMQERLEPLRAAADLPRLTLDTDRSKPTDLAFNHDGKTLRVQLTKLWTAPSMRRYDDGNEDTLATCVDLYQGESMCSTCSRVSRWVDGEKRQTWACHGPGKFRKGYVEGDQRCDCSAGAPMSVLSASWSGGGPRRVGSKVLVEPYKLVQEVHDNKAPRLTLGGSYGEEGVQDTSMEAIVLEKFVLVVGGGAHARYANGTYLPLVVAIPR